MEAVRVLAGFLGEADILRRAMGKKKVKEMEEQRTLEMDVKKIILINLLQIKYLILLKNLLDMALINHTQLLTRLSLIRQLILSTIILSIIWQQFSQLS